MLQRMHKRKFIWLGGLILILIVLAGTYFYQANRTANPKKLLTTAQIKENLGTKVVTTRQTAQAKQTAKYAAATKDTSYTVESPFVKVNPYGTSPLSALAIFTTSQKAKVTYTVVGKSDGTSIKNTVNGGYQTVHQVPIVGLYAAYDNTVNMTIQYEDGTSETKTLNLTTSALPEYISGTKITVKTANKSKMEIGDNKLTIINRTTKEPFAIDADGEVRWYSTDYSQHTIEKWSNGHYMILTKQKSNSLVYNDLEEVDLLGRVYKEFTFSSKTSGNDGGTETTVIHHDLLELPNGNILATVSDGSTYKEDTIVEISYKTGKIVNVIDMKKLLPSSMYLNYQAGSDKKVDWLHMNSLEYDEKDGTLLISNRNQDLIIKLNPKTKKFVWLYSGKAKSSWPKELQKYVLTPTKGTTITGGQHGLTLLNDQNSDSSKENILLYDNNVSVTNGDQKTSKKYSQAVQYHIDTKTMKISQSWAYGKSLGKANFTNVIGYAERQSNGNTLIDFGYKNGGAESNIIEVNEDGTQVFNITIKNVAAKAYVYRAYRQGFYDSNYIFDASK